jgi:hypothetical protein
MPLKLISFIFSGALIFSLGCLQVPDKKSVGEKKAYLKKVYADYQKEADTSHSEFTSKESYISDCRFETDHHITFPFQKPAYALAHISDSKPGEPRRLKTEELNFLIKIINDSASYGWGEVGTPYFDKYITFHNKAGRCIAIMDVSYDYQTESTPTIAKMKNGRLRDNAMRAFKTVLEQK